ncbi:MAG: multiprotein bridging factor aMBF1 [Nitrososphaerales archaeon]
MAMQCEICGNPSSGRVSLIQIEGATFRVCSSCSKLGSPLREKKAVKPMMQKLKPSSHLFKEPLLELIYDYHRIIKQAREKLGLSQDQLGHKINEKPSVIKLLESGKLKPDDLLARKIEHALKIKLLVPPESE